METKIFDRINWYEKDYIYEQYSRIIDDFKEYDKISRKKMIAEIYNFYDDYNNIIDICTTRELKYLEMVLDENHDMQELLKRKYVWERENLEEKFLILIDIDNIFVPDEIFEKVQKAIKNVDWTVTERNDELNEILVGYCKAVGSTLFDSFCSLFTQITNIGEDKLRYHMFYNKLFRYYVYFYVSHLEEKDDGFLSVAYQDFYYIEKEIEERRKEQGLAGSMEFNLEMYRTLFYNDFDINNKKVKKLVEELERNDLYFNYITDKIKECVALNLDREPLKKIISRIYNDNDPELPSFFKIMDEAMDEMPSAVLNGFSVNQAKKIEKKEKQIELNKTKKYIKQKNAHLSEADVELFYKIYFGLLEFTNKKYAIKKNLKIYNSINIEPYKLKDIIDKFWEKKDLIVMEFCKTNPYKFNKEELKLTSEFKKGFRTIVIIAKYEEEYTAFMAENKTYMVKGLTVNIDTIIPYNELPYPVITSIIPFKNVLVYDSQLIELSIKFGNEIYKVIENEYLKSPKYYHI